MILPDDFRLREGFLFRMAQIVGEEPMWLTFDHR